MSEELLVVKILDQKYKIKLGDQDPDYIKELAGFVDGKAREFKQSFPNLSFEKLLLIVSLNLADECFKAKVTSSPEFADTVEKRLLSIKQLLNIE